MSVSNKPTEEPRRISVAVLQLDYQTTHDLIKMLTDIRFRLLAIVPPLATVGVTLVSTNTFGPVTPFGMAAGGVLGFLLTFGVVLYDARNSELYNALIHRAKVLESVMGFVRSGTEAMAASLPTVLMTASEAQAFQVASAKASQTDLTRAAGGPHSQRAVYALNFLGQGINHGSALSLVYGVVLGAWVFPVVKGLLILFAPFLKRQLAKAPNTSFLTNLSDGSGLTTSVAALLAAGVCAFAFRKGIAAADRGAMANALYWPSGNRPKEVDPPWTGPYLLNAHMLLKKVSWPIRWLGLVTRGNREKAARFATQAAAQTGRQPIDGEMLQSEQLKVRLGVLEAKVIALEARTHGRGLRSDHTARHWS